MSEKTDKIVRELGYEPAKSKKPQPQTDSIPQGRDLFQTPNYAVDLLVPFLGKTDGFIWECACGSGKIVNRLREHNFKVYATDIREDDIVEKVHNFLTDEPPQTILDALDYVLPIVVTNPPFSLKQKFYYKCLEYKAPFALLIPADYSGWIIDATRLDGAEKIIPTRRIDYLTPNIVRRVNEGEGLIDSMRYGSISDIPQDLLHKYSSSDFHSMWLTWGLGLGRTETFIELSNQEKKENI